MGGDGDERTKTGMSVKIANDESRAKTWDLNLRKTIMLRKDLLFIPHLSHTGQSRKRFWLEGGPVGRRPGGPERDTQCVNVCKRV